LDHSPNEYFHYRLMKTLDKGTEPGLNYDPTGYDLSNDPIMRTISIFLGRTLRPPGPHETYKGMLRDLLLGMTDVDDPGRFTGNIAFLSGGGIGLVPKIAKTGDYICSLPGGTPAVSRRTYVMRKTTSIEVDLDTTISSYFEEEKPELLMGWPNEDEGRPRVPRVKKSLEDLDTSKIEHYNFVGECSPSFALNVPEALGTGGLSIFALH
jgi:hypothetical protein